MHTQIIAIGGGVMSREQEDFPIERYILEQTGKPEPKVCFIPTASGDAERPTLRFYSVFNRFKCQRTVLSL